MSYILDALKRADRERSRGAVPDIHAQADARPVLTAQPPIGPRPWIWIGLGALLSVGAALLWQTLQAPTAVPPTAQTAANSAANSATNSATTTAATSTAIPAPASRPVAMPVAASPVAPVPAPVVAAVFPAVTAPTTPVKTAPFLPPLVLAASAAVQAPGQDSKPAAVQKPMALQAAPDEVRRQLTALKLAGGVHSQRAADRLLIVDGQVVREGDTVATGVVLEQIQPRSAIFRVREQRVEVPF